MSDVTSLYSNLSGDNLGISSAKVAADTKLQAQVKEEPAPNATEKTGQNLSEAVQTLADFVNLRSHNLNFSTDDSSGHLVVKVVDTQTDEVIRQIPAEEVLKTAERVKELRSELGLQMGMLLDKNV
ncbi:flagellar protein FlaG [Gallaecimonas xiamenensis]|uniref:Flagellar protein FlaG protein n=1 Tax=Gallaecimonas xiamenensis 3-C-1 TaxID=745411 RepID=K2JLZ5_9GAMM|nr:flagellar protein FlaG [Gallaecimonas xiamenensis]EKE75442.1 flagellar protein FlaG protein [Gallaecimonas xiamenensis 3-C-1]